jgi:hypothetical protein
LGRRLADAGKFLALDLPGESRCRRLQLSDGRSGLLPGMGLLLPASLKPCGPLFGKKYLTL